MSADRVSAPQIWLGSWTESVKINDWNKIDDWREKEKKKSINDEWQCNIWTLQKQTKQKKWGIDSCGLCSLNLNVKFSEVWNHSRLWLHSADKTVSCGLHLPLVRHLPFQQHPSISCAGNYVIAIFCFHLHLSPLRFTLDQTQCSLAHNFL